MKYKSSTSGTEKQVSNVQKVIHKLRNKQVFFEDIQEKRIVNYLKHNSEIHPKMRKQDVEDVERFKSEPTFSIANLFEEVEHTRNDDSVEDSFSHDGDIFDNISEDSFRFLSDDDIYDENYISDRDNDDENLHEFYE